MGICGRELTVDLNQRMQLPALVLWWWEKASCIWLKRPPAMQHCLASSLLKRGSVYRLGKQCYQSASHTLPSSQVWFIPISAKWPQLWRRTLTLLPVLQQGRASSQFPEVGIFCIELSHPGLPFVHNNLHLWPVKWIDPAGTWVQKICPCFPLSKRLPIRKVTYLETSFSILKFEKARPNQTSQCWGGGGMDDG